MVRAQCPASLRKFGFCGVLSVVYAARLPMPSSVAKMQTLLEDMKQVLRMKKGKWKSLQPKRTNNITLTDTLSLLRHYKVSSFEVEVSEGAAPSLTKWLKSVSANTCYIVHVKKHALFVEVEAVRSKWRVYDQSGVRTKAHMAVLDRVGGYGRRNVVAVVKMPQAHSQCIPHTHAHASPLINLSEQDLLHH